MRILEIGAGRGDVTLALAATLPKDGLLIAMEVDPAAAAAARDRLRSGGYDDRVSVIVGEPARFLHKVRGPFDVIVQHQVDLPRDKVVALLRPGGMLIDADRKYSEENMTIAEWLAQAKADAEKRGLPELIPMLEGLAQASERLRAADWNENPDKATPRDDDQ
ncbi:MAG: methyltransferase domain-containing protein [Cyanobacteria bacterium]|nr:methyltransferase domain-containing protein [Cyanobacteriota bacterium]